MGRWPRRARAAGLQLGQARPGPGCWGRWESKPGSTPAGGGGADGIYTSLSLLPTPTSWKVAEGCGQGMTGRADRQTRRDRQPGKVGGGEGGVRQTDSGGARRPGGQMGEGSQEKDGQTLGLGGGRTDRQQGESGPGARGGTDRGHAGNQTGGRRRDGGAGGPRGRGQPRASAAAAEREAEAGRSGGVCGAVGCGGIMKIAGIGAGLQLRLGRWDMTGAINTQLFYKVSSNESI